MLKQLGVETVECLVANDDETYTYNKRVNRLPPVQEHRMIVRAVERGVTEAVIADALGLEVGSIRARFRGKGPAPDALLPPRILAFLLAATGFLVPGGGTPYAISWAAAWLLVAYHERRLAMR